MNDLDQTIDTKQVEIKKLRTKGKQENKTGK